MRIFVFLLLLFNLLFLAWTRGLLGGDLPPDALRMQQQLQAERIKVVARDTLPEEKSRSEKSSKAEVSDVPEKPAPLSEKPEKAAEMKDEPTCLLLSELAGGEPLKLETLLKEKFPAFSAQKAMTPGGFWVFIPPLASKPEAERKAAELKRFEVPEFFIVQDGPQRLAISLGVFSSREAAEDRHQELRAKGVRSAIVGEREPKTLGGAVEIRGPESQTEALRQAVSALLPKSRVGACRPAHS